MQDFAIAINSFAFDGQAYAPVSFDLVALTPVQPFPDPSVPVLLAFGSSYVGFNLQSVSFCPQDHTGFEALCTLYPESNYTPAPVGTVLGIWSPEFRPGHGSVMQGDFQLAISNSYQPATGSGTYEWAFVPGTITESTVPEPGYWPLLLLGFSALVARWRRR